MTSREDLYLIYLTQQTKNPEIFYFSSNLSKPFQVKFKYYLLLQAIFVSFSIFGTHLGISFILIASLIYVQYILYHWQIISFLLVRIPTSLCIAQSIQCSAMCLVPSCSVTQLCPTLCDHMDGSPPGSSVHGIFQGSVLEQIAITHSRGSS